MERFVLQAAILHECQNNLGGLSGFFSPPPAPRAIIPDACLLGTFENQDTRNSKMQYIQTISRKNRGLWTVYLWCYLQVLSLSSTGEPKKFVPRPNIDEWI